MIPCTRAEGWVQPGHYRGHTVPMVSDQPNALTLLVPGLWET